MGFDVSHLFCAIVVANPEARDKKGLTQKVIDSVVKNGLQDAVLNLEDARTYFNKFDETKAEQDLDWALGFWRKQGDAIPTNNPNKCVSCEYNEECNNDDTREN
jgi:hypothetical protein